MKKRILSFILLIILLLTLSINAFATESTTITFTEQGLQSGSYDKTISASVTLGTNDGYPTTYSTIYLVTATNANVQFTNNAADYFNWTDYKFLSADATGGMWTVGTTYSVNDSALDGISVTTEQLKAAGIPDEEYDTSCSSFYLIGFDGSYVNGGIDFAILVQVKAASTTITFTEQGLQTGSYDKTVSASVTLGTDKGYPTTYSTIYLVTATNANVQFTNNAADYFNWTDYKFLSADATGGMWTVGTTYSVNDSALDGISVTTEQLKAAGIPNEEYDTSCSAFYLIGFDGSYVNGGIDFAILVQVKGDGSEPSFSTKPLENLLATVTGAKEANWYKSGDRYNGNTYNVNGFWTDFVAKNGPREQAQKELKTAKSENDIEAARAKLQAAIDQLIPADRLNTTPLYEALQEVNSLGYNALSLQAYTETSAAKFKAGRDDAQKYLDSLFTGKVGERKPSDANKNTVENQAALNAAVTTVQDLPSLLVHQSLVSYSEQNTKTIQALAARYGAGKNPGYTEESWSALQSARTDALAYVKEHPVTDRLTKDENRGLREKANTLWNAICALKSAKEQISVTLTYTDDYHLRLPSSTLADKSGLTPGSKNYELTSDSTLYNLLTTAGFTSPNGGSASDKYPGLDSDADALRRYGWSIRVNGVQQTTGLIGDQAITNFMGQLLHDGDQVQIALFEVPTRAFNYIYREELDYWGQLPGVLGSLRFAGGSSTSAEAGAELSLTVEGAKTAHIWSYNGSYTPYEGAKIAVYGPKTEAGYPAKATIFDAVTDAEGKTSILLYEEGTYLVTAFEPRENDESTSTFYSGMMAAPYLEVKVGKASDEDGVKAKLKAELDAVYNAYPQEQFGAAAWEQLKAAYDKAVKVLNKTDSSVAEARAAQQTAIAAIQKLQNEMLGDNQDSLSRFRKYLAMLPDDTGEITNAESIQDAIEQMKAAYASLNSYQKSLLTGPEEQKYEKIIEFTM